MILSHKDIEEIAAAVIKDLMRSFSEPKLIALCYHGERRLTSSPVIISAWRSRSHSFRPMEASVG